MVWSKNTVSPFSADLVVGINVPLVVRIAPVEVPAHLDAVVHLLVFRRGCVDVICNLTLGRVRKYTDDSRPGDGSVNDVLISTDSVVVGLCPAVLILPEFK